MLSDEDRGAGAPGGKPGEVSGGPAEVSGEPGGITRPRPAWLLLAALALWLWVAVPLATAERTLFLRDVFSNHFPAKAFGAAELAAGRIPAFNPRWGLGQPFRGNPSTLAFYPGNLLYVALPFWSAFNLHYALHWLLALFAMRALARELGQGEWAALAAALAYAGSGWVLSTLTFYNIVVVAAWWPLALWGGARGGRRGIALGGLACGLALLGGEPVTAALGLVPLLLVAVERRGLARGLATVMAIGAVGVLVALPQLVATARVAGFTFRTGHGMIASQAVTYTLHPLRYAELLVPFPFGWPGSIGRFRFWALGVSEQLPFFLTLHFGIVALWLAVAGARRRPSWGALAVAGLLLAWLAGLSGEALVTLTAGLFRFPEKLLFWFALAAPLLVGWGLERVVERRRRPRWPLMLGALALLLAAALWLARPAALARAAAAGPDAEALVATQLGQWALSLLAAGGLLALGAWAAARASAAGLAALVLLGLLQLSPLVLTTPTEPFRRPGRWAGLVGPGADVFAADFTFPPWPGQPSYRAGSGTVARLREVWARNLAPAPGMLHGLSYPLAPDLEGMGSPFHTLLLVNLPKLPWPSRATWMRAVGVEHAVLFADPRLPQLEPVDAVLRFGAPTVLFRVRDPAPDAWWPPAVEVASGPAEALKRVSFGGEPIARPVLSRPVAHRPGARVRLVAAEPDRLEVEVEGEGGVLVLRRAYQPLYRARAGATALATLPVNLALLGVEVPPGRHPVVVDVSAGPEIAAGVVALLAVVAALWAARPLTPRPPLPSPSPHPGEGETREGRKGLQGQQGQESEPR